MGKKKGKKKYNDQKSLRLICRKHKILWKDCPCAESEDNWMWVYVTEEELKKFIKTGMLPNWRARLFEGSGIQIPLEISVEDYFNSLPNYEDFCK